MGNSSASRNPRPVVKAHRRPKRRTAGGIIIPGQAPKVKAVTAGPNDSRAVGPVSVGAEKPQVIPIEPQGPAGPRFLFRQVRPAPKVKARRPGKL